MTDPKPGPTHESWRYLFLPNPEWTLIRGAYYRFTGQCAQFRCHQFGVYSEPTCCEASEWLLWSGTSNPGIVREIESRANHTLASPSYSLKTADFSSSIELDHFILPRMCSGLSFSLYLHIKAHFFIFIKEQNGNSLKSPNSCITQSVVFWRACL